MATRPTPGSPPSCCSAPASSTVSLAKPLTVTARSSDPATSAAQGTWFSTACTAARSGRRVCSFTHQSAPTRMSTPAASMAPSLSRREDAPREGTPAAATGLSPSPRAAAGASPPGGGGGGGGSPRRTVFGKGISESPVLMASVLSSSPAPTSKSRPPASSSGCSNMIRHSAMVWGRASGWNVSALSMASRNDGL